MGNQPRYHHSHQQAFRRLRLAISLILATTLAAGGVAMGLFTSDPAYGPLGGGPKWFETLAISEILASLVLCLGAYEVFIRAPRNLRWFGIMLSVAASLRYVTWRMAHTLNLDTPGNTVACLLLLSAEFYALLMMALGHFQTFWPTCRRTPHMPPGSAWPTVDVFITTYNEEVDLVRRTAVGCHALDYPHKRVFILDDGRRPQMRALAEEIGVGYVARDDNLHAKAGNLNHALGQTAGQLIAQFDADHVPVRSFLRETVPFFLWDENLAFVQTPHHFYNYDAFQRNLLVKQKVANEQDLFFRVVQPGNDRWNAAFFCGSNAVMRRGALDDVGGFATETITEDAHTALRLHAKGWNSVYLDRNLAGGLAAETFGDLFTQRLRWGVGMCRILRVDNPLFLRGLSLAQRLCYFTASAFFFYGIPRQIYFLAPVCFVLVGVSPIDADIVSVLAYYLPHWLAAMLLAGAVSRNVRHTFWSEVFETALAFPMSFATIWSMVTRKKPPFKVTPKNTKAQGLRFHLTAMLPQLTLLIATVTAIGFAFFRLHGVEATGVIVMNLFWCFYNLVILAASVLVTVDRPQLRNETRVPCLLPAQVSWVIKGERVQIDAATRDLSEGGTNLVSRAPLPVAVVLQIRIGQGSGATLLNGRVIRTGETSDRGLFASAIGFETPNLAQRHGIIRLMYTDPDRWSKAPELDEGWASLFRLVSSSFRWMRESERPSLRRMHRVKIDRPAVLVAGDKRFVANAVNLSQGGALLTGRLRGLERAAQADLTIKLDSNEPLTLPCRVARRKRRSVVVVFDDLSPEQRADLIWSLYVAPLSMQQRMVS